MFKSPSKNVQISATDQSKPTANSLSSKLKVPEPVEGNARCFGASTSSATEKFLAQSSKFKNILYLYYVKFTSY